MEKVNQSKKQIAGFLNETDRNNPLFQVIIDAIQDKKGDAVVSLDLREIEEAVADFFIICEAQSNIQIKTIAENIEKEVQLKCAEKPYRTDLGDAWTLVDYVNIVVHIFQREERRFYDLEGLWLDAEKQEHN